MGSTARASGRRGACGGELAEEGPIVDGARVGRGDPRRSAERGREARGARGSTALSWRRRGARAG